MKQNRRSQQISRCKLLTIIIQRLTTSLRSLSQQMPPLPCDKYGYCPGFCKISVIVCHTYMQLNLHQQSSCQISKLSIQALHRYYSTLTVSVTLKDGQMLSHQCEKVHSGQDFCKENNKNYKIEIACRNIMKK